MFAFARGVSVYRFVSISVRKYPLRVLRKLSRDIILTVLFVFGYVFSSGPRDLDHLGHSALC